jgi:hypothetical protein
VGLELVEDELDLPPLVIGLFTLERGGAKLEAPGLDMLLVPNAVS